MSFDLGLEHFCPWPQEGLSSESRPRIVFVSLVLASSLVSSTPLLSDYLTAAFTYPHPLFLGFGDKMYSFSSPAPERNMLGRSFLKIHAKNKIGEIFFISTIF